MKKNSLAQLAKHLGQKLNNDRPVSGFSVDSRILQPGNLFFALPGAKVDGHQYIAEVASKGASGVVVSKNYSGPSHHLPLIYVDDTLVALQTVAKEALSHSNGKIVAVTGSLGKTTTKEFIASLLRKKFRVMASPGNSNSQIGVPLSILNNVKGDEEILVLEMGMTESGHIRRLLEIAPPDIAVITTVALVHAENFESLEGIARAKAEILTHPKTALGIFPNDLPIYKEVMQGNTSCYKMTFSLENQEANYYLEENEGQFRIYENNEVVTLPALTLPGRHIRHNFLAALAVARNLGLAWRDIQKALPLLKLPERRFEQVERFGVLFINDSYNASEQSIKAALEILPVPKPGKKRIAIIGEICFLGRFSEGCHQAVGEASLKCIDSMICLGKGCGPIVDCFKQAERPVSWCASLEEVVKELKKQIEPGDVVLLKGSNKHNLWNVLRAFE